ncbi:hypothetical protein SAMN05421848_2101 [Kushneria avicenniae]|uniref:Uncharacterized protein n=1 Tax=Kushneria avicenniae TaxID=402385 RepID=A0A1I1KNY0_9GAMM|nr:hypothetical protein [Kushneria avicenniae]SFC62576.1 hypothetical protein SAMN05421848_2101 [Kushneria avicenniae]
MDRSRIEISESPYENPFCKESIFFNGGEESIAIIDQYNGRRPFLINKSFLDKGRLDVKLLQTIILDSHLVDYLHSYTACPEKLKPSRFKAVHLFLTYLSKARCDYNPVFYLAENCFKTEKAFFIEKAGEKLFSLLKLHCMDEDVFCSRGVIELKEEVVEIYKYQYNEGDLRGCALRWAENYYNNNKENDYENIMLIYVCLMKMVLIHNYNASLSMRNIVEKVEEFSVFLLDELGISMARELELSVYYFSGLAGSFLGVQKNTKFLKAIKNLKSTAWDLFLMRLPEMLLYTKPYDEVNISYIATTEKKLIEFSNIFELKKIFISENNGQILPILDTKNFIFEGVFSNKEMDEIKSVKEGFYEKRVMSNRKVAASKQELQRLVNLYETQISFLCKK